MKSTERSRELRARKDRLGALASEGTLTCSKHRTPVSPRRMYLKRCYISRDGGCCKYLRGYD